MAAWTLFITERGVVYLGRNGLDGVIRLPFKVTDDGLLSFAVSEKWLRASYGRTVELCPKDLVGLCSQRVKNCKTLAFPAKSARNGID